MAKVAIVTGSATGLGAACAVDLAGRGWNVAINYTKSKKEADETYAAVKAKGADAILVQADMGQDADCKKLAAETMKAWGRIDGLVNNAGGQFPAPLKDISLNGWNAVVANNMTATFLVSKEVYLRWMEKNGGAIVSVGADFELGNPGMGHSGAARAGQTNFTYTASVEWAHSGVRINSVLPGSQRLTYLYGGATEYFPPRCPGDRSES